MDEEENLKKITRLLEQGCTMLATHHSCGAPLFRCKGQVICPICSFQQEGNVEAGKISSATEGEHGLVISSPFSNAQKTELHAIASGTTPKSIERIDDISQTKNTLRVALLHKLNELQKNMEEEKDLDRLRGILECVEGILKILRILE